MINKFFKILSTISCLFGGLLLPSLGRAVESDIDQVLSLHSQATAIWQYHPGFSSSYRGTNSLDQGMRGNETVDATIFAGVTLWNGASFYANPEIDQGFGLSNTLGIAGFSSGAAYKIGASDPYFRLQRAFFRQEIDLGGDVQAIDDGANRRPGTGTSNNITLSLGKLSVVDIFDANRYAHDPRSDFLNWSVIDAGGFDYAADAWGYSYGGVMEWNQSWWTWRTGIFDLSRVPNSKYLEIGLGQFSAITEAEGRYAIDEHGGKFRLLVFVNRGRMGRYDDALNLDSLDGAAPNTAKVRHYQSRTGILMNVEQEMTDDLGIFARLSYNDGTKEAYEFSEINDSIAFGGALIGTSWRRPFDTWGLAIASNGISRVLRHYLANGGTGILIGDGRLDRAGRESIIETYYALKMVESATVTFDYQFVVNPAYNRDRGPVSIMGLRLHTEH
jgi:high affinity Mn2+ porin